MNQKNLIFFGDNGLTSTSANFTANLAKEFIQNYEALLNNLTYYTTTVGLIGSSEKSLIKQGDEFVSHVPGIINKMAKAKSLIAWLREAIKAKKELLYETEHFSVGDYCKMTGIDVPQYPTQGDVLTEDEYYSTLSLKERNRYYELETTAATIGKMIHPDGSFANARKKLAEVIQNPNKIEGDGRDTVIYSYKPTINLGDVDKVFFELQAQHREAQAQLNSIKYACEQAINESQAKAYSEHLEALSNYRNTMQVIEAELKKYKQEETERISKLKIIIPDSLKDIYETVSKLGK